MPLRFMRPSLQHHLPSSPHYEALLSESIGSPIPPSFDSRTHFSACRTILSQIRNQGKCGSCWAFGAVETLADRICIASSGQLSPKLSAQSLIDCDQVDEGCQGGFLDFAWEGLVERGALKEACDPYEYCDYPPSANCSKPGTTYASSSGAPSAASQCPRACATGGELEWFKAASAYAVAPPGDVAGMQRELMTHGPFEVAFFVYSDFYNYTGGVYRATKGSQMLGSHAVKMVGWGEDAGVPYWTVANSWSPAWGEKGLFRIARGTNECGIEQTPAAGLPLLPFAAEEEEVATDETVDRVGRRPPSSLSPKAPPSAAGQSSGSRSPRARPTLQLQFSATMRVSESDHGDGCQVARKLPDPVVSKVWFDDVNQRLAQTNAALDRHPIKPFTDVTRFDVHPPATLLLEPFFNETVCYEKPLAPGPCPNGTALCPATWGHWGELCPFTSVFGMWYPNTTFLETDPATGEELWQWTSVTLTPMPNGSTVNITRNYTYHVAPADPATRAGEPRPLRRYEWTQGLPNGGDPSFRFCAVFDYTQDYQAGPPADTSFGPPAGVPCINPDPHSVGS
jgi:cathepsin B